MLHSIKHLCVETSNFRNYYNIQGELKGSSDGSYLVTLQFEGCSFSKSLRLPVSETYFT